MTKITELEPKSVWQHFYDITRVPRPSKKEEQIRAFLRNFAQINKLELKEDDKGNIVIKKAASKGYEKKAGIVLQSHVDMVCEKESDSTHNFDKDPIETYIKDGWVHARGTTLGADCGIGMALAMAVLTDKTVNHPAIEALFTVDEEQGLSGAMGLAADMLTFDKMINLDSEDEGEIYIGCAGGIDTVASFEFRPKSAPVDGYTYFKIVVGGLVGGHSGDDIEKGRANANKIATRFLWHFLRDNDARLSSIDGGNLRNAIARDARAVVGVKNEQTESLNSIFEKLSADIKSEYAITEPDMTIELTVTPTPKTVIGRSVSHTLVAAMQGLPNGVIAMSQAMKGMVETSSNLASVKIKGDQIVVVTSQRSSVESAKSDIAATIESVFLLAGAKVVHSDGYPGWAPNPSSEFVKSATATYKKIFTKVPKVKAIHAGLECGLFLTKYPNMDMISIGPTLRGVHSPSERLEIATVTKVWDYLRAILG